MSEIDPNILGKIKKCLALSGSSNTNEAATALRQAHALMEKYGLSVQEITMADIGETKAESKTMSRDKPAHWEIRLATLVGNAFGCQVMVQRFTLPKGKGYLNEGEFIFVGLKQQAEIAAYTATVLIRKCKAVRQQWLNGNSGGWGQGIKGMKAKKTRMADMFAEGWVEAISKLVTDFANPPEVDAAILRHIHSQVSSTDKPPTRAVSSKDVGQLEYAAVALGMQAAKDERLYRPMETGAAPLSLEERG